MRKKYLAVLLAAGIALSFTGCKDDADKEENTQTEQNGDKDSNKDDSSDAADATEEKAPEPTVAITMLDKIADCVELGKYKGVEYQTFAAEVTDKEIEENICKKLSNGQFYKEVKEVAKNGDFLSINFTGTIGGKSDDNLSSGGSDTILELGSGQFIPGFEDGLVGHKAGEEVVLDLTFPKDYQNADYAGKDVQFTVNITKVNRIPELTDDYIKECFGKKADELGEDDDSTYALGWTTLKDAKEAVKKDIEESNKNNAENYKTSDIVSSFLYDAKFKNLPQEYIDEYYKSSITEYESYAAMYSMEMEDFIQGYFGVSYDEFKEEALEYAEECVKEDVAMWVLAEKENITLTDEEFEKRTDALYKSYASSYGYTDVSQFINNNGGEETVKFRLRLIMAREWLVDNAVEKGTYKDREAYCKKLPWYNTDEKADDTKDDSKEDTAKEDTAKEDTTKADK